MDATGGGGSGLGGTAAAPDGGGTGGTLASGKWVSAYYAAWQESWLPPEAIDFGAITHLQHFAVVPNPDLVDVKTIVYTICTCHC
jgi:hypothetical protein